METPSPINCHTQYTSIIRIFQQIKMIPFRRCIKYNIYSIYSEGVCNKHADNLSISRGVSKTCSKFEYIQRDATKTRIRVYIMKGCYKHAKNSIQYEGTNYRNYGNSTVYLRNTPKYCHIMRGCYKYTKNSLYYEGYFIATCQKHVFFHIV